MQYLSEDFVRCSVAAPEYAGMLDAIRAEVDSFAQSFWDDPEKMSRWGHRYFCDEDGGRLIFDLQSPHSHRCEVCEKVFLGEVLDGVWVYFYRNQAILTAWKAAAVYAATREETYLAAAVRIISFYADNYERFCLHNKEDEVFGSPEAMGHGCGRIMPQALNEAILLCRIVQTLEILKADLPPGYLDSVYRNLFCKAYRLLKPQIRSVHNICCWELAAIGMMGLLCGAEEMISFAFHSEYNIRRQINEGVTKDGFWYEGSIHYNFFLLEGVTMLMLFCGIYGYGFGEKEARTIEGMLLRAYDLAFDNHIFPNPNDGWPDINLKTFLHVYHVAARSFGEKSQAADILRRIESAPGRRVSVPLSETCYWQNRVPLERLLLNPGLDLSSPPQKARASRNFPLSNFAVLRRGKLNVFLKYGLNGPSHAHPDIMNMEIAFGGRLISRDLSNAGYQSRLCNRWHRTTLCHNTVVTGGKNIESTRPGECVRFTDDTIEALARDVYDGVDYMRALHLGENAMEDVFEVTSQEENVFDYVLHLESGFRLTDIAQTQAADLGFDGNGYEHVLECSRILVQGDHASLTAARDNETVTLTFDLSCGRQLFLLKTPDNPVNRARTTFLVRGRGRGICFRTNLMIGEDGYGT